MILEYCPIWELVSMTAKPVYEITPIQEKQDGITKRPSQLQTPESDGGQIKFDGDARDTAAATLTPTSVRRDTLGGESRKVFSIINSGHAPKLHT